MAIPFTNRELVTPASPGDRITATRWNDMARRVDAIGQATLRGKQASSARYNNLTVLEFAFSSFPSGRLDYMNCTLGTDPTLHFVAKPRGLRPSLSSHGGVTFTYSSDVQRLANGTETQVIVPAYGVGDPILAIGLIDTGVSVAGQPVLWCDSNMSWGRGWAKQ